MDERRIPLFPLGTVLFPGLALPLHIFEPRYLQLVRDCMAGDRLFGVCLIRSGQEVGGPADPYPVGTTCEIVEVAPLDGDRLRLLGAGRDRFRILRLHADRPYLSADIELWPDTPGPSSEDLAGQLRDAARRYMDTVFSLREAPEHELELPSDPVRLSYLAAALLRVPATAQQDLLAADLSERLSALIGLLERERRTFEAAGDRPRGAVRLVQVDRQSLPLN